MIRVIGVRFRTAGKVYFFDPLQFDIKKGDHVIVETARGIEFGTVMAGIMDVAEEKVVQSAGYRAGSGQPGQGERGFPDMPGKNPGAWAGNEAH